MTSRNKKPAHYSISEARAKLSALADRVEVGEIIVITKYGRPAARLVPLWYDDERDYHKSFVRKPKGWRVEDYYP